MTSLWMQYNSEKGGLEFLRYSTEEEIAQEIIRDAEIMLMNASWHALSPDNIRKRRLKDALER